MKNLMKDTENRNSTFEIAGIIKRFGAFAIDFIIFGSLGMIIGYFWGVPLEDESGYDLSAPLPASIMFMFSFLLWPISEKIWGQTIGKRILKLKVVSNNGTEINLFQAFGRFLFGFIDLIGPIGILVALVNKQNKRIGDLIAKTIVIQN